MKETQITERLYFQDFMPGNVCFGCGSDNPDGLQIKSFWEDDEGVCIWQSEEKFHGWSTLMNGGIMATVVDCHCMGTAMAYAYRSEGRDMDTTPIYRYATGTLTIKYLKPTSNVHPIELRASIKEVKGRKITVSCQVYSQGMLTATSDVIAIRVYDSSKDGPDSNFI